LLDELKKAPWVERPVIAGRLVAHCGWILVMFFYWALADYGRSFMRPALWLIVSRFFFYWSYLAILAPLMPKAGTHDADAYKQAVRILAFGSAMSFLGPPTIDAKMNKFLFCPDAGACLPVPPEGYHWLVLGQNSLSIILVFFIGLALRNYFKIK
jgi:hypothetical protein